MAVYAISDLHIGFGANRAGLEALAEHPDDWLIVAGDVGETLAHLEHALRVVTQRFARVLWVPGNHELWSLPGRDDGLKGEARYQALVSVARSLGVVTPEDPYPVWSDSHERFVIAPLFLLYDYSFRPDSVPLERAVAWALEEDVLCADEMLLSPEPHASRAAWCAARCDETERRLDAIDPEDRVVLVNHFPMHESTVVLPTVPRFRIWCGTRRTADWHVRYRAVAVVTGHLHIRRTTHIDGVRFEEVSLGYPPQWRPELGVGSYLRRILPLSRD